MKVFMDIYSFYNVFSIYVFYSEKWGGGMNLVYGSLFSSFMDCLVIFQ